MERMVVKFGGSVITYKQSKFFPTKMNEIKRDFENYARTSIMKRLTKELYEFNKFPIILVNGAGQFGHYLVLHQDQLEKKEMIHDSVDFLNRRLVNYLEDFGIEVKSCAPFSSCNYLGNDRFGGVDKILELGSDVLARSGILSTYGDIVPNINGVEGKCGNYHVISGDDLMVYLAELWDADKIISVVEGEGIFEKDPIFYKKPKLIKIIRGDDKIDYSRSIGIDVTGGFSRKIRMLREWTKKGKKAQVVNGFKENCLKRALLGDETVGTLILP